MCMKENGKMVENMGLAFTTMEKETDMRARMVVDFLTTKGSWVLGNHHGKGTYIWENGDTYEGDWVNDEQTGWGRLTWASGNVYEGNWLNSKKEGKGVHFWCNGDVHRGQYKRKFFN